MHWYKVLCRSQSDGGRDSSPGWVRVVEMPREMLRFNVEVEHKTVNDCLMHCYKVSCQHHVDARKELGESS